MPHRPPPPSCQAATAASLALATVACVVGLGVPGFYRDAPALVPQLLGQDLVTLLGAIPALAVATVLARRGSLRGYVAWLGLTGYLLYTYATYAFMTAFNELYLVYTTLLWLSLYAFVVGLVRLDVESLSAIVADRRVRAYVAFELAVVGLVGFLWLAEVLPAIRGGGVPPSVAEAGLPTSVIYSLDFGVVLPGYLLSAYLLSRREPWGVAFTGVLLVKAVTLGAAILAMAGVMAWNDQPPPAPMVATFGLLFAASLALTVRFLRSIPAAGTGAGPTP